jgi:tetratricopeptide (TPR) repeat protein
MATSKRVWALVLMAAFIVAALLLGGWRLREVQRYQTAIEEIEAQIAAGRHGLAARSLDSLLAWKPGLVEAVYLRGVCERARGRPEAAFEAWSRVPQDSPLWGQAIMGQSELLVERGRLADAEQFVSQVPTENGDARSKVSMVLVPMYCHQGRFDEAARLIEAQWDQLNWAGEGALEQAINLVRLYMDIQRQTPLVEATRVYLDQAAKMAPDDDRVWLGQADLALCDGKFDLAARLIEACLRRRPEDFSVWRAKLRYALAAKDLTALRKALTHLPADQASQAEIDRLVVWLANQRSDVESERRALERLRAADPADLSALERLIELTARDHQPQRESALRQQKLKIEQLQTRYQQLYIRNQSMRDAPEMARLAAQLGREFEARAFLKIAVAVDPSRGDLRDELMMKYQQLKRIDRSGRTLAEVLAVESDARFKPGDQSPSSQTR